jgi:hypothetical protein
VAAADGTGRSVWDREASGEPIAGDTPMDASDPDSIYSTFSRCAAAHAAAGRSPTAAAHAGGHRPQSPGHVANVGDPAHKRFFTGVGADYKSPPACFLSRARCDVGWLCGYPCSRWLFRLPRAGPSKLHRNRSPRRPRTRRRRQPPATSRRRRRKLQKHRMRRATNPLRLPLPPHLLPRQLHHQHLLRQVPRLRALPPREGRPAAKRPWMALRTS